MKEVKIMKRSFKILLGVIAALAIFTTAAISVNARRKYPDTHTTTFFVHGYGSSYRAEQQMANYMVLHGASNSIVRANIDDNGNVTFNGKQSRNAKNPIVEVNYDANHPQRDFKHYDQWLKNVIQADQQRNGTTQINLVGHSMGNIITTGYLNDNMNDSSLPRVKHLVILAGSSLASVRTLTSVSSYRRD